MDQKKNKVAGIFDFDKTIISIDSFHRFILLLYCDRYNLYIPWLLFVILLRKFRLIDLEKFKICTLLPLRGKSKEYIDSLGESFYNLYYKKIYSSALSMIKWHKKQSHKLILATSCPNVYIQKFLYELNFDYHISTELEYKKNIFTGKFATKDNYQNKKAENVEKLCINEDICLKDSYFYTDNISDLPLTEIVRNIFFINPNKLTKKRIIYKNINVLYWEHILNEKY